VIHREVGEIWEVASNSQGDLGDQGGYLSTHREIGEI
jgi:hypothetical protein